MTSAETILSIVMLGGFLWAVGFLLPKARREHDAFAVLSASLLALLTLFGWLFFGVAAR